MNDSVSISVNELTMKFGKFTAVDNVSFEVKKGDIFGFLGANGAGKSTTIRLLCGLLKPSSGNAFVGGFNIVDEPENVKRSIGYMSQRFSLYEDLTVKENLSFYGGIYGIDDKELSDRVEKAIAEAGLIGEGNKPAGELAGGWKQRLALSCALLHKPKIVFLDEPTSGVDPLSRRNFWNLIQSIAQSGTTVFVTTHYLEESEYCNKLAFIYDGRIIIKGAPSELKRNVIKSKVFEIEAEDSLKLMEILQSGEFTADVSIFGLKVHLIPAVSHVDKLFLEKFLREENITFKNIREIVPSMEDVFIELIKSQEKNA
ncbi:ATP-binding cassette domain-containing protein [candidate division KSB1 bacterium]